MCRIIPSTQNLPHPVRVYNTRYTYSYNQGSDFITQKILKYALI